MQIPGAPYPDFVLMNGLFHTQYNPQSTLDLMIMAAIPTQGIAGFNSCNVTFPSGLTVTYKSQSIATLRQMGYTVTDNGTAINIAWNA